MTSPVTIGGLKPITYEKALLDTGCKLSAVMHTQVAKDLAYHNNVRWWKLPKSKPVRAFNGAEAVPITHMIVLPMKVRDHYQREVAFLITDLGSYPVILGEPWFDAHDALPDCRNHTIVFRGNCHHEPESPTSHDVVESPPETAKDAKEGPPTINPRRILRRKELDPDVDRAGRPMPNLPPNHQTISANQKPTPQTKAGKTPFDICVIGALAFDSLSKKKDAEVFAISVRDIEEYDRKRAADVGDPKDKLPKEFHEYIDVFSKEGSNKLSPHRPFDHRIELTKELSSLRTEPLRRTTEEENKAIREYIEEYLAKDWIRPSSASYASPILFVRKPGGGIRLCVDYRKLNDITKKDKYPLPLIEETLTRVLTAKWFSKIDIRQAFHRLRMATEEDEELTTFMTRFGNFAYRVLPFGLCGGPASFQRFMNESFFDVLDNFVSIYLDDILIYSKTREEHTNHIRVVLERLREIGIEADIRKCEFYTQEVKYLGVIVTPNGIRMDPEKVRAIQEWEKPATGKDITAVRRFLGFCNYYRRFIQGFSRIARPLNNLLTKTSPGEWTEQCDKAFEELKKIVATEPVLRHFDPKRQSYIECDASDTCTGGILSQLDDDDQLRPIAFFSTSMSPAERNYAIYDKELLAIIRAFEEWRPELMGTEPGMPVKILTDHKALEYFKTTKQLSRRQARWAEKLSEYNFVITYRPGAKNGKADILTRRDTTILRSAGDPNLNQTLLPPEKFEPEPVELAPIELDLTWVDELSQANRTDRRLSEVRTAIDAGKEKSFHNYPLSECTSKDGLLLMNGKIAVPQDWITKVLTKVHESPEVGHAGEARTTQALKRSFDFPGLWRTTKQFCRNCQTCNRAKTKHQAPAGLLQPLPPPDRPWKEVSMDFVTGLPKSKEGFNAVFNVVCRLTKMRHYIPCQAGDDALSAEETAKLFEKHVWRLHGLPESLVSDRDPRFAGLVFQHLCKILGIDSKLSTAFHPQTDGQTEIINAEMERYLRTYVNYQQDDWVEWLPKAEFAANAAASLTTSVSPFFANYGCQPRMSFDESSIAEEGSTTRERVEFRKANSIAIKMKSIWEWSASQIEKAQQRMKLYADKKRSDYEFQEGDKVYVSARNINTQRPCKKLDDKWHGPFPVLKKLNTAYRIQLPDSMKIHNVFHASLLAKDPNDPLPEQEYPEPEPVIIDGEKEWEVDDIRDVRKKPGRSIQLQVQCSWVGYPHDYDWWPLDDFKHATALLDEFYAKNPSKPRPIWLPKKDAAPTVVN